MLNEQEQKRNFWYNVGGLKFRFSEQEIERMKAECLAAAERLKARSKQPNNNKKEKQRP